MVVCGSHYLQENNVPVPVTQVEEMNHDDPA